MTSCFFGLIGVQFGRWLVLGQIETLCLTASVFSPRIAAQAEYQATDAVFSWSFLMCDDVFSLELVAAVKRMRDFDSIQGVEDRNLTTIISALEAGIYSPDCGGQFDALAMLIDLREKIRNGGIELRYKLGTSSIGCHKENLEIL